MSYSVINLEKMRLSNVEVRCMPVYSPVHETKLTLYTTPERADMLRRMAFERGMSLIFFFVLGLYLTPLLFADRISYDSFEDEAFTKSAIKLISKQMGFAISNQQNTEVDRMARVLVFHYKNRLPKLSPEQIKAVQESFGKVLKDYPDVKYNGTWVTEDGLGICDWEAPSAEVVKEVVAKALGPEGPAVDEIVEVKRVM